MDPFEVCNLHGAIRDLGVDYKRNRSIRESLLKTICHVEDVILGKIIFDSMPTTADIEKIPRPLETLAQGITLIRT